MNAAAMLLQIRRLAGGAGSHEERLEKIRALVAQAPTRQQRGGRDRQERSAPDRTPSDETTVPVD